MVAPEFMTCNATSFQRLCSKTNQASGSGIVLHLFSAALKLAIYKETSGALFLHLSSFVRATLSKSAGLNYRNRSDFRNGHFKPLLLGP